MNWDSVADNWKQFKGTVKARWGKLTDDQLMLIAGKRERLLGKIQELYGIDLSDAEFEMQVFERRHQNYGVKQTELRR